MPRGPATGPRPRVATGPTCWRWSTTGSTGTPCSRPCSARTPWPASGPAPGRSSGRARATTWPVPWASACVRETSALSFGTSGVACTVTEEPRADPSGTVAGFADATGRFLPLVCTLNATKVTDSVARLLGVTLEEFDALALSAPAGAGGLVLVPHFDGERTPEPAGGHRHTVRHRQRRLAGQPGQGRGGRGGLQPPRRRRLPGQGRSDGRPTRVPRRRWGPERRLPADRRRPAGHPGDRAVGIRTRRLGRRRPGGCPVPRVRLRCPRRRLGPRSG